jgi:DNA-binding NarL/FixJ family response regulator
MKMGHKKSKEKKYEQALSSPYWEKSQGASLAAGLQGLVTRLFGARSEPEPTVQEIIDYHLTPRERKVAYLAALGFSDKEIADALGMNFQTVRVHLRNTLNKMRLNDVSELQRYFSPRSRA